MKTRDKCDIKNASFKQLRRDGDQIWQGNCVDVERKKEDHEGCFQGTLFVQGTTQS